MDDFEKIRNNIRYLRKAYGESQEKLGKAIGVSKTAITNYEKGIRHLSRDVLIAIANHYMITLEDLVTTDYSPLGKIQIDSLWFYENIELFFPIAFTKESLENANFKKAYDIHRKCYKQFYSEHDPSALEPLFDCVDYYIDAMEDESSIAESAANIIGLFYLLLMGLKGTMLVMHNRPASINQIIEKDEKIRKTILNLDSKFEQDTMEAIKDFHDMEMTEFIDDLKRIIKRSPLWSDLCDYYFSLQYLLNIVENGLSWPTNLTIGYEMIKTFATVGNEYALFYLADRNNSND